MAPITLVKSPAPEPPHVPANRPFPAASRREGRRSAPPALRVLLQALTA